MAERYSRRRRTACLILVVGLLGACSTAPTQPGSEKSWGFTGKIGLWAYGEQESANIDWRDCDNSYLIRLSGPLGVGGALIYGTGSTVSLHRGDDTLYADSPEELLASLGWYLPVSSLRFWLRGQASPDAPYQREPEGGAASSLTQAGWHITYRYQNDHIARIAMDNGQIRLQWIIRDWRESVTCTAP